MLTKSPRTDDEDRELWWFEQNLSGGFCIAGRWGESRRPQAYEFSYGPQLQSPPETKALSLGTAKFWGCPNLIERVIYGLDDRLFARIMTSGKWTGTFDDLFDLVAESALGQPRDLPLREAIDWIHASIYTTIKAMKFSHLSPVCGGPIEIAVISSDRTFRWVRHKRLDEAIRGDETRETGL